jgi:two-component system, sensor histidine kinase
MVVTGADTARRVVTEINAEPRDMDAQAGNACSLFRTAITLETKISERTAELTRLTQQLQHEIAVRRRTEEALRIAKAEAEQANVGKTRFLAAASHDLMQPLNSARCSWALWPRR